MSRLSRLVRWSSKIRSYWGGPIQYDQRICLLHIMKTAGTSLRLMLENALGAEAVFPNAEGLSKRPHGWYPPAQEVIDTFSTLPPHRLMVGHFPASILAKLPEPYAGAVVLRDPVQRSLSALAHEARLLHTTPLELLRNTEFVRTRILDYQTKILGCQGTDSPNQHDRVDDKTLKRALQQIDDLGFVGITERFLESCRLFDALFMTTISKKYVRENVLRPNGCELDDLITLVEPYVQRDIVLYKQAVARFEKDLMNGATATHRRSCGMVGSFENRSTSSDVSKSDARPLRRAA